MEQSYAQALWKMIEGGMDHKKAVKGMHDMLVAHGRESLFPRIARAFERIAAREHQKNALRLTIAHEGDEHKAKKEAKEALVRVNVDSGNMDIRIDPSLIGGWRLEGKEQLIDASYKKHLLALYENAIK